MRWLDWFGDDSWQRPTPALSRRDVWVALAVFVFDALCLELVRSFADFTGHRPVSVEYLTLVSLALLVLVCRRWPLLVGALAFVHFFATCTWVPELGYQTVYLLGCFYCFHQAVAWARDRRAAALLMAALTLLLCLWMAGDFAVGQAVDHFNRSVRDKNVHGLVPPLTAWVVFTLLVNVAFMAGAIAMGQAAWRQARDEAALERQARTIEAQAADLRDQAVVEERLRIARELHDVVAHHVSVMGIQASAARRMLERDPAAAAQALGGVETSSRQAVTQMRSLLGALRGAERGALSGADEGAGRDPQPTLAELPALLDEVRAGGLAVDCTVVEYPPSAAAGLPLPLQLSLYRTVQEALANVRRHSTATRATVVLRVQRDESGRGWAEAEVLDDGRPRGGTSGSGLGLLGMRERITSHGGTSEIGPRAVGGYRVRVRFPLGEQGVAR